MSLPCRKFEDCVSCANQHRIQSVCDFCEAGEQFEHIYLHRDETPSEDGGLDFGSLTFGGEDE